MSDSGLLTISPEVASALDAGKAVVALETALVSHGFPDGSGVQVAGDAERAVRSSGATPATIGVVEGTIRAGLSSEEISRFADGTKVRKAGPRDLAACVTQRALGATTVAGTLAAARLAGICFMSTGGMGGVHRGFAKTLDISADLAELARTPVMVVSSGVKSLLDVGATVEALESLSVPVIGWQTDALPLFLADAGGPPLAARVESESEAATVARNHWALGREGGLLLTRPAEGAFSRADAEAVIGAAVDDARSEGVSGQALTPYILDRVYERTGGRSAEVNRRLIVDNAGLAARVASAYVG